MSHPPGPPSEGINAAIDSYLSLVQAYDALPEKGHLLGKIVWKIPRELPDYHYTAATTEESDRAWQNPRTEKATMEWLFDNLNTVYPSAGVSFDPAKEENETKREGRKSEWTKTKEHRKHNRNKMTYNYSSSESESESEEEKREEEQEDSDMDELEDDQQAGTMRYVRGTIPIFDKIHQYMSRATNGWHFCCGGDVKSPRLLSRACLKIFHQDKTSIVSPIGVEYLEMRFNHLDIEKLKSFCVPAPFGDLNKMENRVDPKVRAAWEIANDRFEIELKLWHEKQFIAEKFAVDFNSLVLLPYKINLYEEDSLLSM